MQMAMEEIRISSLVASVLDVEQCLEQTSEALSADAAAVRAQLEKFEEASAAAATEL